jgi:hypothetical protein
VLSALQIAATLDPSHPLYQRDLGSWELSAGSLEQARGHLARATLANPADMAAWRASAVAAAEAGDAVATSLAEEAVRMRNDDAINLLTLAYVLGLNGDETAQRQVLVQALRYHPWMTATDAWHATFGGDVSTLVRDAGAQWRADPADGTEHAMARAWLGAMDGDPLGPTDDLADRYAAAALAIDCRPDDALLLLGSPSSSDFDSEWLIIRILVGRIAGEDVTNYVTLAELRIPVVAFLATNELDGASPYAAIAHDLQFYGRRAVTPTGDLLLPSTEAGLSAWLTKPLAAARIGAPESRLSECR